MPGMIVGVNKKEGDKVNEGEGFAAAFQAADFIPPLVNQMVTTGEETGNLPKVLSRVADYDGAGCPAPVFFSG